MTSTHGSGSSRAKSKSLLVDILSSKTDNVVAAIASLAKERSTSTNSKKDFTKEIEAELTAALADLDISRTELDQIKTNYYLMRGVIDNGIKYIVKEADRGKEFKNFLNIQLDQPSFFPESGESKKYPNSNKIVVIQHIMEATLEFLQHWTQKKPENTIEKISTLPHETIEAGCCAVFLKYAQERNLIPEHMLNEPLLAKVKTLAPNVIFKPLSNAFTLFGTSDKKLHGKTRSQIYATPPIPATTDSSTGRGRSNSTVPIPSSTTTTNKPPRAATSTATTMTTMDKSAPPTLSSSSTVTTATTSSSSGLSPITESSPSTSNTSSPSAVSPYTSTQIKSYQQKRKPTIVDDPYDSANPPPPPSRSPSPPPPAFFDLTAGHGPQAWKDNEEKLKRESEKAAKNESTVVQNKKK